MSKVSSGLFHGTMGDQHQNGAEQIIAARTKGLDLQEHPISQKQLSSTRQVKLSKKVEARTATKAEYKLLMWNKRFKKRRSDGVKQFWHQERERLLRGEHPTRNWGLEQIADILQGKKPKFMGKSIQGHHSYSASKYPHLANRGEIIYPVTNREHLLGWHGGHYRRSLPGRPIRFINDF